MYCNFFLLEIILIVIIFYIINNYLYKKKIHINENFFAQKINNIDIVIARYNEDLIWTLEHPFNQYKYIVYNKGYNENFEKKNIKKIIKLPNIGKCDHTYLNHIITNYYNLSEIIVFFPGSLDLKYKKKIAVKLLMEIDERQKPVFISLNQNNIKKIHYNFKLNNYKTKHIKNRSENPETILFKSNIRPFGLWFDNTFGNIEINCLMYYGIFSIHRDDVIQHNVSRYETLIKDLSFHSNPEVGHYIERSWCAIFHPMKNTHIIKYKKID
jgi:hypothetical protein